MDYRSTVSPATLRVTREDDGIVVTYLDNREAHYRRPPEPVESPLQTPPGKAVHLLVTDPDVTEGSMVYLNDRNTHDDILESTGVGRVFLEPGESETLLAGLRVEMGGHSIEIAVEHEAINRRVFVFAEDEFVEHAYEIVPDATDTPS